jgi:hypothetical protein
MAILPNVSKVLRVSMIHLYGSDTDVVTRFFYRYTGTAPSPTDLNTFCAAVSAGWFADIIGMCYTTVTLVDCVAVDLSSPSGSQGAFSDPTAGTRTGTELPADASLVASYTFGRRYRGGHSRGYWPMGVAEDLDSPQDWSAAFTTDALTAVEGFFGTVDASGWSGAGTLSHVSVSYYLGFHVVTNPVTGRARNVPTLRSVPVVDAVTGYVARTRIGSQRRRLGR